MVAEAIGEVRETPLWEWLIRGRGSKVAAFRSSAFQSADIEKLRTEIRGMMGLPYDYRYAPGDDSIYCSELISKAFERATKIELGKWEALGSLNWKPFETFIRNMEAGELPLDRLMVTPASITRDTGVAKVH